MVFSMKYNEYNSYGHQNNINTMIHKKHIILILILMNEIKMIILVLLYYHRLFAYLLGRTVPVECSRESQDLRELIVLIAWYALVNCL